MERAVALLIIPLCLFLLVTVIGNKNLWGRCLPESLRTLCRGYLSQAIPFPSNEIKAPARLFRSLSHFACLFFVGREKCFFKHFGNSDIRDSSARGEAVAVLWQWLAAFLHFVPHPKNLPKRNEYSKSNGKRRIGAICNYGLNCSWGKFAAICFCFDVKPFEWVLQ